MADNDPKTNEPTPESKDGEKARPRQKDKGKVVTTAFGEPMSGGIADIADGDDE